ncbi:hypothetical protein E2320_002005, partial [Naja naja]
MVTRYKLWEMLEAASVDHRLLHLLCALHTKTSLKMRCNMHGFLLKPVKTQKGLKRDDAVIFSRTEKALKEPCKPSSS